MRKILSGNEALAVGAYEAGVEIGTGYPGTPSTEIMTSLSKFTDIYTEWSVNEKVALEVSLGASIAGKRTISVMKDLGLNVACDILFSSTKGNIKGGMVIIVADDVGRLIGDSMNDSRHYSWMAEIPLLEPSDNQEAKDFVLKAFELSEKYKLPVIIRTTAILTHSYSAVEYNFDKRSYNLASKNNNTLSENIYDETESIDINYLKINSTKRGFIGSGVALLHAIDAYPDSSYLKLGMSWPLPYKKINDLIKKVDEVFIIEESDEIIEKDLKSIGFKIKGSEIFKRTSNPFNFTPTMVTESIEGKSLNNITKNLNFPFQLPVNCPGCPHRNLFHVLSKAGYHTTGDSGCYAVNMFPPVSKLDAFLCMGAGVSMAHGANSVQRYQNDLSKKNNLISVIGDGVFYHTGINAILNLLNTDSLNTVIIADNDGISMTGGQETLGTGKNIKNDDIGYKVKIEDICSSIGIESIRIVDPYDTDELLNTIHEEVAKDTPSVIISRRPCLIKYKLKPTTKYQVNSNCTGCLKCVQMSCMALTRVKDSNGFKVEINQELCTGCGLCSEMCSFSAIEEHEKELVKN